MVKRLLTAFLGLIVFFAVVLCGNIYVLFTAVTVVAMGILWEIYGAAQIPVGMKIVGLVSGLFVCFGTLFARQLFAISAAGILVMLGMIAFHGRVSSEKVLFSGFCGILIPFFLMSVVMLERNCDKYCVLVPFICAWLTDTGAYFCGKLFGKHKLSPNISPNKTIEGAIGGTVFALLGCVAYVFIIVGMKTGLYPSPTAVLKFAVMGLAASVLSQSGDLAASCIKRDCGKKDFGAVLPGHGGLTDRFDSVLFAAPFVYYFLTNIVF